MGACRIFDRMFIQLQQTVYADAVTVKYYRLGLDVA